ncbi:hypothetical protein XENORESO_004711 [Xenotaenia resolanae]|uniref:Uncharacterized protein n=1 Tax=Xenotaenia resolanae TaxID=208358 RepID=A0ABV0W172_9TELE
MDWSFNLHFYSNCPLIYRLEKHYYVVTSALSGLINDKHSNCNRLENITAWEMYAYVSQSFSTAYSIVGHGGAGAYLQQSMGKRQGTPWTGRQSIAGQHTNNHARTHSYT